MHPSRTRKGRCIRFVAQMLIMLGSAGLLAQTHDTKTSSSSSKSTSSSKSASSSKPAASAPSKPVGGSRSGVSRGPSAGGEAHQGPPATGSSVRHTGPTTRGATESGPKATGSVKQHGPDLGKGPGFSGKPVPRGSQQTQLNNGSVVQRRPSGSVSDVHDAQRGMDVHHGINGSKRVLVERPDHSRVVAERGRPGYVQRQYIHNNHEYARRTYYDRGRAYDRYYRRYPYRGIYIDVYAPVRYYPVGFYVWLYNPWYQSVVYPWGWVGSPWYGYYGAYFTPYPAYLTASLWLTDFMISTYLETAYQSQEEARTLEMEQQPTAGTAPLTPEVKQMIADEVKSQLDLEKAEAQQNAQSRELDPGSSSIARLLSDGRTHVFIVGGSLDVVDTAGMECAISDGDALELVTPPLPSATSAELVVLSSKGGRECPKSATVTVALTDLQDMQNHMRETIDQGLQELQAKQGTGGLPAAPPSAQGAPVDAGFAKDTPPLDPNGGAVVNQQLAEADQSEKEVVGQAQQETGGASSAAPATPAAGPPTIVLGQSIEEVTARLGAPLTVIDLGSKKIYRYKDMKITFKDGKVSDAE